MKLPREFYQRPTLTVAQDLLGKCLIRRTEEGLLVGKIVETEAYIGENDLACHASRGKTPRNEVMFGEAGHAYVYFTYGMFYCLNVVTEKKGFPAAVLIRSVEPMEGIKLMIKNRYDETRRSLKRKNSERLARILLLASDPPDPHIANGPGKLCQAMKIDKSLNGIDFTGDLLYLKDRGNDIQEIVATSRIGVEKAGESAQNLWRFYIKESKFVSKK
ncbi:DNA-3-methyladenine glycosylase [Candidatus Hakubella thermalkaliphila]|uniref:Putative 3-methyladenine DNA glycosylase n=2 Tax=Candidatus Hakubella thermalkaliphila TaxID=2754717 RepID=A0A6V8PYE6_9ACTN|nr:DNA-3-methyladenine glycosylase [Candidatus Hakubella thermalkaliphila]MBT9170583.1 putative 3-methyladenine DNA glycosylase [Actinomycetota bacterium]GFP21238.1 DNA-3-methyladenine glycosylase [Candidatus Hakubella thermalkaliphila]GFP37552.1 DNA-3-methyladenine glycosylase [Candidatus Hakubella thermalkaliphila]GFP38562.1 DNA-3-methyladenine glycosylase [Candidatus Hakubella thermalkaliphila]GFP42733.1 DNA-3-methyladenine glycosylase [Candidatus Hakubella thermalkaliphila]